MVNTDLSLWTPRLAEDAHRQASIQHSGRCCNCSSTEYSLGRCPAPFKNVFFRLNPEFGTHDPDGSMFETGKLRVPRWRQHGSYRGHQSNGRLNASESGRFRSSNREHNLAQPSNNAGTTHATYDVVVLTKPTRAAPSAPRPASAAMRYGLVFTGYTNPNTRQPGAFQVNPAPTP